MHALLHGIRGTDNNINTSEVAAGERGIGGGRGRERSWAPLQEVEAGAGKAEGVEEARVARVEVGEG